MGPRLAKAHASAASGYLMLAAAALVVAAVSAQAVASESFEDAYCHEYVVERPPELHTEQILSPLVVSDNFLVGTASVELNMHHRRIGALNITVSKSNPDNDDDTSVVLVKRPGRGRLGNDLKQTIFSDLAESQFPIPKEAEPFTGMFQPGQSLSTFRGLPSQGVWLLTIHDVKEEPARRPMILSNWTLTLCEQANQTSEAPELLTEDDKELVASIAEALAQDVENAFWEAAMNSSQGPVTANDGPVEVPQQVKNTSTADLGVTATVENDEAIPAASAELHAEVMDSLRASNASNPFDVSGMTEGGPAMQAQSGPSIISHLPMAGWPYAQPTKPSSHSLAEQPSLRAVAAAPLPVFPFIQATHDSLIAQYKTIAHAAGSSIGSIVTTNYLLKTRLYSILFTPSAMKLHQRLATVFGLLKTPEYKFVRIQFALAALTTGYALTLLDSSGLRSLAGTSPMLEEFLEFIEDTTDGMPLIMAEWKSMKKLTDKIKDVYKKIKDKYEDGDEVSWEKEVSDIIKGGTRDSKLVVDEIASTAEATTAPLETLMRNAMSNGLDYLLGLKANK